MQMNNADFIIENSELKKYVGQGGDVVIPDGVTSIGKEAFQWCKGLKTIVIPNSVTSIGDHAFSWCEGLENVVISDGVTSIGETAFYDCKGLTVITLPKTIKTIASRAFDSCKNLQSVYYNGDVESWCKIEFDWYNANPLYCAHNLYINGNLATELVIPNTISEIKAYAFTGWNGFSVVIPDSVNTIGNTAFYNCDKITNIVIPNSVTSIEPGAFKGCKAIEKFTIPDTIKVIRGSVFAHCSNLSSIKIGKSLEKIDDFAFLDCDNLSSIYCDSLEQWCTIDFGGTCTLPHEYNLFIDDQPVTDLVIPNTVTEIKAHAFEGVTSLKSITIPDSVRRIEFSAFRGRKGLTNVSIGNEIEFLDNDVFAGCDNLQYTAFDNAYYLGNDNNPFVVLMKAKDTHIADCTIHKDTKIIHSNAFSKCKNITSIVIPDGVKNIGGCAFDDCWELSKITLPASITSIEDYAFHSSNISSVFFTGTVFDWCNITFAGECANPLSEAHKLYIGNKLVKDLVVPSTVKKINDYAFYKATCLKSVRISEGATEIGKEAFWGCDHISDITIPDSVIIIKERAFQCCSGLQKISLGKGVLEIEEEAFFWYATEPVSVYYSGTLSSWCKIKFDYKHNENSDHPNNSFNLFVDGQLITDLIIPNDVSEIKDYSFKGCCSIQSVSLHDGVTSIGKSAFEYCQNINSINAGQSLKTIGEYAFATCEKLPSIVLSDRLKEISPNAFANCSGLSSFVIQSGDGDSSEDPSSMHIDESAFEGCRKITVFGRKDSYAELFAQENVMRFKEINESGNIVERKKADRDDNYPFAEYLRLFDKACELGENKLNYPYSNYEWHIANCLPKPDADYVSARNALVACGVKSACEIWDKFVVPGEQAIKRFPLEEYHYRVVFAIAISLKMYISPDVKIMVGFPSSKYNDKTTERWVLDPEKPFGEVLSAAQYRTYLLQQEFPAAFSLSFDASPEYHDAFCERAEELQENDVLQVKILDTFGKYMPCIVLYKGSAPVGHIGRIYPYQQTFKAFKKFEKKLEARITKILPISKRYKGAKNPLIEVEIYIKITK